MSAGARGAADDGEGLLVELNELLTTGQVVKMTGYSRETICGAARRGELVAVHKLPGNLGAWLFSRGAVDEWVASPGRRQPYRRWEGAL